MSGHYSTNSYNREWKAPTWANQSDRTVSFPHSEESLGSRLEHINWGGQSLVKFNKNFYREHETVSRRSESEVKKIRDDMNITVYGQNIPKPVLTFEEANFPDYILKVLSEAGFSKPTSIQSQGIL
jgi:ATP-dependent RNA helicase DDX5/DBP2